MDDGLQNYKILVEIFKGYLDTVLTVHTSFYAFTGAIVAYFLSHHEERPFLRHSLLLPILLGLALAIVSFIGTGQALTLQDTVNRIKNILNMQEVPPVDILRQTLFVLGSLDAIICVSLSVLYYRERAKTPPPDIKPHEEPSPQVDKTVHARGATE